MKRLLTISACCFLAVTAFADGTATNRPTSWARSIKVDGVRNLYQVSTNLYRSAQPTAQGMLNLERKGIETIVTLRSFHSDRDEIGDTGLGHEHIYLPKWTQQLDIQSIKKDAGTRTSTITCR